MTHLSTFRQRSAPTPYPPWCPRWNNPTQAIASTLRTLSSMTEVVVTDRDYMVAPCNHLFHDECLRRWMEVKMECPTCRAPLPTP